MKASVLVFYIAFGFTTTVYAELRKCVGSDGKVTYSDVLCVSGTKSESGVRINENSIDASGDRALVKQHKGKEAVESAMRDGTGKCKFSYYSLGDDTGKQLAANAKKECLENIAATATGQATSDQAYQRYKDHKAVSKRTVCSGSAVTFGGVTTGSSVCR